MADPNNAPSVPSSMPTKDELVVQTQDASKEMFQPFLAGFFQGFFDVARKYYREKRERKAEVQRIAEENTAPSIPPAELQEAGVWIGPGAPEEA